MSTLAHDAGTLILPKTPAARETGAPAARAAKPDAPIGYRWVSRRWRVLPDGTRDYAVHHGKAAFSVLLPVSSKLRSAKR